MFLISKKLLSLSLFSMVNIRISNMKKEYLAFEVDNFNLSIDPSDFREDSDSRCFPFSLSRFLNTNRAF